MIKIRNYKICVYAISKNEEKFVRRWYESIKDADYICVLDTGSTDNTVNLLKDLNVNVKETIISPWRFDNARNESLKLIPNDADICICLDLDEVMLPNWKDELLKIWNNKTTRIKYTYNWYLDENNVPKITFYADKIHANKKYCWINPVHEVLQINNKENEVYDICDKLIINHYPDINKSRSNYLKLLELSVKENPNNDRNMHYLGREYMYYKKWNKSIDTLIKHLNLKSSTWKDERCASMRFISRCYINLKRYDEAIMWLNKAINEANYLREPFVELAMLYYDLKDYKNVIKYINKALKIKNNPKTYINEPFCYDETVYDLLSIAYFYENNISKSIYYARKALKLNPSNNRIRNNLNIFLSIYDKKALK